MEDHAIIYKQSYESYKSELNYELNRAAEGFVRIGYLLKIARDTDILAESKYSSYTEFAQGEFGLDKSQVSRFIQINDRFSQGGNSDQLMDKYKGFGSAKLTLMLALPEEINEELTPEYTKAEIQTIKEEVEAEQKITPLEVMAEEQDHTDLSMLARVLYKIGEDDQDLMMELMGADYLRTLADEVRQEMLLEILAPAGQKMYMARVQGVGKMALVINGRRITLTNVRENSKEEYAPEDIEKALAELYRRSWTSEAIPETARQMWELIYQRELPEKEVAPVQPKKETKVSTPQKPQKAKIEHKTTENDKKPPKTEEKEPEPIAMPEPVEEEKEPAAEQEEEPKIDRKTLMGYKSALGTDIKVLQRYLDEECWGCALDKLKDMQWRVEQIKEGAENG